MKRALIPIIALLICGVLHAESMQEIGRPFLEHMPYRVYAFQYRTAKSISYSWPWINSLQYPKSIFSAFDTLQNEITGYIEISPTFADKDSTLYCILVDSAKGHTFESTLLIDPEGDTLRLWSNGKPIATASDELLIQQQLEEQYTILTGRYNHLKELKSITKAEAFLTGIFAAAITTTGTLLLLSDDTKKKNAGGICLGVAFFSDTDALAKYFIAKDVCEEYGELKNRLKNWSQADTDSLIAAESKK